MLTCSEPQQTKFSSLRLTFRYYIPRIFDWYDNTYIAYLLLLTLATIKKEIDMFSDNYGIFGLANQV